jgi:ABC-type enterochelin transport system permease subunit
VGSAHPTGSDGVAIDSNKLIIMDKIPSLMAKILLSMIMISGIIESQISHEKFASLSIVVCLTSLLLGIIISVESKVTALEKEISRIKKDSM